MLTPLLKLFLKTFVGINTVISEDKDFIFFCQDCFKKSFICVHVSRMISLLPKAIDCFIRSIIFLLLSIMKKQGRMGSTCKIYIQWVLSSLFLKKKCADSISNAMKRLYLDLVISKRNHLTFKNYFSIYCLP